MNGPVENNTATWTYMPWVQEYAMQNKRLTKEHYQLVYMANRIQHLLSRGEDKAARDTLVQDFAPVAKRHLRFEILVMNAIDFKSINADSYVRHCLAHANLEEGIDDFCARIAEVTMSEVINFIRNWLDNHIKKEDAAYNAQIMKLGIANG